MFDRGWRCKVRPDDGTPFGESGRTAKIYGMTFQRIPKYHQHVTLGRFDALGNLEASKACCMTNHLRDTVLNRRVELILLAGIDLDV